MVHCKYMLPRSRTTSTYCMRRRIKSGAGWLHAKKLFQTQKVMLDERGL